MRTLRTIGAFLLGLALVLAPLSNAHAADTNVTITKLKMTSLEGWPRGTDGQGSTGNNGETYTGGQINDIDGFFGQGTEALPGVTFTYWSVTEEQYNTMMAASANYETVDAVSAYVGSPGTAVGPTNANGQVSLTLGDGFYWFVENTPGEDGPLVNASAAVPFGLKLPLVQADGSELTDVYVYPKNTVGDEPTVDKDVTEEGNDSDSANVGDTVTWLIKPNLPADVAEYQELKFTDNIDTRLNYQNNVVVTNGDGTLVEGTDYTLTQPTVGQAGGTLVIDFTETGIAKLTPGNNLRITFDTVINETAVVGTPIPNDVTLDYTNGSGVKGKPKNVPPEDQPEVWTGGENFVKVDEGDGSALAGAVFALHNADGETATNQVVWTQAMINMNKAGIDAGLFATEAGGDYTATSATNVPAVGSPVYLRSGADGKFEILGLQGYEPTSAAPGTEEDKVNTISHPGTYVLKEVVAPEGYALRTTDFPFTVTKTSYNDNPSVKLGEEVSNKKITIPPTGGIGTVVFIVAGLALMGVAFYGMRRRSVNG
ncbi:SpaH/EbpB family LPXTG-anchored major pilin [Enemella sp. A6]|uniref:SpaH/EbpB family LPXTG-anchored major pilin n=1 Tax=Enemella sp. A6 TaxID=3440152 RepID=UPI003EBF9B66